MMIDRMIPQIPFRIATNCKAFQDPLVVACKGSGTETIYALVFPAVQYICTKQSVNSRCEPTGEVVSWHNYSTPTQAGSCNGAPAAPAPTLTIRSPDSAACSAISHKVAEWALPTKFSAPQTGGNCCSNASLTRGTFFYAATALLSFVFATWMRP